jgi:MFS family permease
MALPPQHELTAGDSQPRAAAGSPAGPQRDAAEPRAEAHEAAPAPLPADRGTVNATIVASFLLRFASRVSFSLLVFALGQRVASATLTVLVLEAFYLTELTLSPLTGTVSDRAGRKPFLVAAPVAGAAAALWLWFTAAHLPAGPLHHMTRLTLAVLLGILAGRLLEGCTTGLNAPAALGALTDATAGHERVRVRALTAFEAVTIAGLALAIPFAGEVSAVLGLRGFLIIAAIDVLSLLLLARFVSDREVRQPHAGQQALRTSLRVLREPRVAGFLPAWCAVNAIAGIWITLGLLVLTYADPAADQRFPNQLLYGGFSPRTASLIVGGFGVLFLLAMGAWSQIVPRVPRTSTMLVAMAGLAVSLLALAAINGIGGDPNALPPHMKGHLLRLVVLVGFGILLLGGFPPAALSLVAHIADSLPRHGGAVMGIYAFGLGASQLVGTIVGGVAVDHFGIYGLLGFSVLLGALALASILTTRHIGYDSSWRNSGVPAP